jgi:hypothetical protein
MTVQISTRFKQLILGTSSFEQIFDGGRILVYSGAPPATADHPVTGTLLAQITELGLAWAPDHSAGGLLFGRTGAWAIKDSGQNWVLSCSVAGTAGWFRLVGPSSDAGLLSYSAPRIDGTVRADGSGDMNIETLALTVGYTLPVQQFLFSFPPTPGA